MMKKEKKRFVRKPSKGIVAGVCAGIADYFDIDVVIVRIIWVFLLAPGGLPGLIPYVLLWLLAPAEDQV